jgi:hypothetical protein
MNVIVLVLLVLALVSFGLGAAGVTARVDWDQLGKAFLVGALIATGGF